MGPFTFRQGNGQARSFGNMINGRPDFSKTGRGFTVPELAKMMNN
jgi:hypothetical protein